MTFIDAVLAMERSGLKLCADQRERSGSHHSICVYSGEKFIGKLRWPEGKFGEPDHISASVDDGVMELLKS